MIDVFSDYVAGLSAAGEPPDLASYEEVREHLRILLVVEMRRRGLRRSPPEYLGVIASSWGEEGALDELVSDVYVFTFVRRLRGLAKQQRLLPTIRPLVVRNVRNFLTDRQRKADPLGYRIFGRLKAAIGRCLEAGKIFLRVGSGAPDSAEGDATGQTGGALNNDTILSFRPGLAPLADRAACEDPVRRWNSGRDGKKGLMPELVTAVGRAVPAVVQRLSDEVQTLPADGILACRFGALIGALKSDARQRWQALWRQEQDLLPEDGAPGAPEVPVTRDFPDEAMLCQAVLDGVSERIALLHQGKDRQEVGRLWLWLRATRLGAQAEDLAKDRLPSLSRLGLELDISRERLAQHFRCLAEIVRHCLHCADAASDPLSKRSTTTPVIAAAESPQKVRRGRK